ncbi:GNAT family N-acetyltransferase [Crocinitomix catalasitica]|uniref:GNAT family N-acetyltransferase n=1 Tax=Crocinitomix catalasitica TaxID=184607 RepID=UPI00068493B2|nr:GNAT family N-acetyltransferase [Crocinitomix catalasitica]
MVYFNQESERLTYRKLTADDIPSWLEFFQENDRLHFLGMDLTKKNTDLAGDWIRAQFNRYEQFGLGHLAAIEKETGLLIGLGGIIPREIDGHQEYEIAYSIKPKFWGKGYATELAQTMKHFGMKHIKTKRFISIIDVNNVDSARVAKKNGMDILFKTEFLGMQVNIYGIEKTTE